MKKFDKGIGIYLLMIAFIFLIVTTYLRTGNNAPKVEYSYSKLINDLEEGEIKRIEVTRDSETSNAGKAKITHRDGTIDTVDIIANDSFVERLDRAAISSDTEVVTVAAPKTSLFMSFVPLVIMFIVFIALMFFIFQQMQGGGGGASYVIWKKQGSNDS